MDNNKIKDYLIEEIKRKIEEISDNIDRVSTYKTMLELKELEAYRKMLEKINIT